MWKYDIFIYLELQYSKNKVFNAYSDELSLSSSLREILEESELKLTV